MEEGPGIDRVNESGLRSRSGPPLSCPRRLAKALEYGGEEAAEIVLERYLGSKEHRRDVAQWVNARRRSIWMERMIMALTAAHAAAVGLWMMGGR